MIITTNNPKVEFKTGRQYSIYCSGDYYIPDKIWIKNIPDSSSEFIVDKYGKITRTGNIDRDSEEYFGIKIYKGKNYVNEIDPCILRSFNPMPTIIPNFLSVEEEW